VANYKHCRVRGNFYFEISGYDPHTLELLADFNTMRSAEQRQAWEQGVSGDRRLTHAEQVLAIAITSHLNLRTQRCFPDQERLAARLGKSERQISRLIKKLEAMGWLGVTRHNYRGGMGHRGQLANDYRPLVPEDLKDAIGLHLADTECRTSANRMVDILSSNGGHLGGHMADIYMSDQPGISQPVSSQLVGQTDSDMEDGRPSGGERNGPAALKQRSDPARPSYLPGERICSAREFFTLPGRRIRFYDAGVNVDAEIERFCCHPMNPRARTVDQRDQAQLAWIANIGGTA